MNKIKQGLLYVITPLLILSAIDADAQQSYNDQYNNILMEDVNNEYIRPNTNKVYEINLQKEHLNSISNYTNGMESEKFVANNNFSEDLKNAIFNYTAKKD